MYTITATRSVSRVQAARAGHRGLRRNPCIVMRDGSTIRLAPGKSVTISEDAYQFNRKLLDEYSNCITVKSSVTRIEEDTVIPPPVPPVDPTEEDDTIDPPVEEPTESQEAPVEPTEVTEEVTVAVEEKKEPVKRRRRSSKKKAADEATEEAPKRRRRSRKTEA